jgi:hypothetical protein
MFKAMYSQVWLCGVLWSSVGSSRVRHGLIDVLRGMALYSTVLSCPVRLRKLWFGRAFRGIVLHGGVETGPAASSGVCHGKVSFWHGGVMQSEVRHGKLLSWSGEDRFGVAGFGGLLYGLVRFYCGLVRCIEALHGIVKFCPVKYCVVLRGKALFWHGIAWRGSVGRCLARYAKAFLRHGTVESGFVRLCAAGQALVRRYLAWPGEAGRCMARFASVSSRLGDVLLCKVRRGPVLQGRVRLGLHGYGGIKE